MKYRLKLKLTVATLRASATQLASTLPIYHEMVKLTKATPPTTIMPTIDTPDLAAAPSNGAEEVGLTGEFVPEGAAAPVPEG